VVVSELWDTKACILLEWLLKGGLVPLKVLAHFLDPSRVFVLVCPCDEGHTVGRVPDHKLFILFHAEAHLAVEGDPSTRACLFWKHDGYLRCLGKHDGAEAQGVWADRREGHHIGGRVDDRASTG